MEKKKILVLQVPQVKAKVNQKKVNLLVILAVMIQVKKIQK